MKGDLELPRRRRAEETIAQQSLMWEERGSDMNCVCVFLKTNTQAAKWREN